MVWEFINFTATQILSENKFWWIERDKNMIFGNFRGTEILIFNKFVQFFYADND